MRGPENIDKLKLIRLAKKTKKRLWRRVAEILSAPRRRQVKVNIGKINKYAKPGDTIIIPGKVLGKGELTKKLTVVAFEYSASAIKKLESSGCSTHRLIEYLDKDVRNAKLMV